MLLVLTGFVAGLLWTRAGLVAGIVATAVVIAIVVAARLWLDDYMEKVGKERIKYMRGGQAEGLIAWILEGLDDRWHIFNGIKLEGECDTDHVLIGPGGMFCISTKSHRGLFEGIDDRLLHNGEPSDFAKDAMHQAMKLKDRLAALMGDGTPWIQPVLALPFGFLKGRALGGKVWLVHQDDILKKVSRDDSVKLDRRTIDRAVKAMTMIAADAADLYVRPNTPNDRR